MILDSQEISDNLKKQGSFIPGIRIGKDTKKYLHDIIFQTAFVGAIVLTILALLPYVLALFATVTSTTALGGTGIIVCIGVVLETLHTIESVRTDNKYATGWF